MRTAAWSGPAAGVITNAPPTWAGLRCGTGGGEEHQDLVEFGGQFADAGCDRLDA